MSLLDNRKNDPTVPPEDWKAKSQRENYNKLDKEGNEIMNKMTNIDEAVTKIIKVKKERNEIQDRLEMMSRRCSDNYIEASKFKEQRDELLEASKELISTIDYVVKPDIINNQIKIFKETVNRIKGEDK